MKKRFTISLLLLILLSTYSIQDNFNLSLNSNIKKIILENNVLSDEQQIKKKLSFLYETNLFLLNLNDLKVKLKELDFIESFEIKKIYPQTIKIKIFEQEPIAIIQNKKEKKYFTSKGDVINFKNFKRFENLPLVFGDGKNFKIFLDEIQKINFPVKQIKKFYFFESKRWDLVTINDQVIKLPIYNYNQSLQNFLNLDQDYFEKYKIFDYRIKDQLILK